MSSILKRLFHRELQSQVEESYREIKDCLDKKKDGTSANVPKGS
jgi:hypothetical protein